LSYIYTSFKTSTDFYTDSAATNLHGIGVSLSYDKRSNVSYPRSGYFIELDYTTYLSVFNESNESNQITIAYNHYVSVRNKRDVIATRFYAGIGIGDLEFNQQFIVRDTDIRGYSYGQFRGNQLYAIQGEYRWNFYKRFGAVGFLGMASVFDSPNDEYNGKLLPGAGLGVRYTYMKETNSNIGFDVAKGIDDWGFYFRFTEAF